MRSLLSPCDMKLIMWAVFVVRINELVASLQPNSCSFNSMCSCSSDQHNLDARTIREISCVSVPFFKLPNLPESSISQLAVVGSRIPALEAESLAGCQVHSLTLSNNHLQHVADRVFSSTSKSLKYLDLSYNELDGVPFAALKELKTLQWLNLHGNQIHSISGDWSHSRNTIANLFLGENDITEVPSDTGEHLLKNHCGLCQLQSLIWLNLDGNRISEIQRHSLPVSLQTVSVSHNLMENFPLEIISVLPHLQWLYLRGNHIKALPEHTFLGKLRLEKIDLGENCVKSLQRRPFNNSVYIRDLNLAFNDIKVIGDQSFAGLGCGRIILSFNLIETVDGRGLEGLEDTLEFLDFDHNNLVYVPFALGQLKALKYLYLSSNSLMEIPENAFEGCCINLKAVSFSGNRLTKMPTNALQNCSKISHFNIAYNEISELLENDFVWGRNIKSLILSNNRITILKAHMFVDLRHLKELSLSFNPLRYIDVRAFEGLEHLESLELSFSLENEEVPVEVFKMTPGLQWLSIDNNNFYSLSETSMDYLPELKYVNLDYNRLGHIPTYLFKSGVHSKLKDVRFSSNRITEVYANTFSSLKGLDTIMLGYNRIRKVHKNSFKDLTNLRQLILSDNLIAKISAQAVSNAPNLHKVDLHNNLLKDFSFGYFANLSNSLHLNLSRNRIATCSSDYKILNIEVLDLRQNQLVAIPICLQNVALLKKLFLDYNIISTLEHNAFMRLTSLEILTLRDNNIENINRRSFFGLQSLQLLDLSRNIISLLHVNQFSSMPKLRILNLSSNNINYFPKDVFSNTILEKLDLSYNSFSVIPSLSLSEIGMTLRQFSIKSNNIEHIDSTTFLDMPHLQCLDLGDNKLTILPDNVFTSLSFLQKLKLNSNPLRANFKELFHYAQNLKKLNLANTGITSTPTLPLPNLIHLNLSHNLIEIINRNTVQNLLRLKYLDLSFNRITYTPAHLWIHLSQLKTLDLSHNPIKEIIAEDFQGLRNLQVLNIQGLKKLEKFDSRTLTQMKILSSLSMETWPNIENFRGELCTMFANLHQLRILKLHVQDSVLDDQLLCIANKKIRHLEISGRSLKYVDRNAFARFTKNPDLKLIVTATQIEELPEGLFSNMYGIAYLTIDLRNNMLSYLSPEIFYGNITTWKNVGTTLISGGLIISENPFKCGCHLAWLSHWLRRWMSESVQSHNAPVETVLRMTDAVREATCTDVSSGTRIPIVQMWPEDMSCHASALSNAPSSNKTSVIFILLCYTVFYLIRH